MKVIASKLQPEGACTYFVHGDKLFGFERFVSLDQARAYAERANAALDAHDAALLADYKDALRLRDEAIAFLKSELADAKKKYEVVSELADGRWKCSVSYMRQRDEARAELARVLDKYREVKRDMVRLMSAGPGTVDATVRILHKHQDIQNEVTWRQKYETLQQKFENLKTNKILDAIRELVG